MRIAVLDTDWGVRALLLAVALSTFLPDGRVLAGNVAGSRLFERAFHQLFVIRRSTNRNEVVYEVRSTPEGFVVEDPINVYWAMKERGGGTEGLTGIEKSWAYGVRVRSASPDEVVFSIKALPERAIRVRGKDTKIRATTVINGTECRIKNIFIQTNGSGLFPAITFTEIEGVSEVDGKMATERIESH